MTRFDEFLNQQLTQSQTATIDWELKLEVWKVHLDFLYQTIETFLKSYIQEGKIQFKRQPIIIEEEYMGEYKAEQAIITFAHHKLRLVPIGTNIIGAEGRVDLKGPLGKVRIVLVKSNTTTPEMQFQDADHLKQEDRHPEQQTLVWKIATAPPLNNFYPLTKEAFLDALMEITDG